MAGTGKIFPAAAAVWQGEGEVVACFGLTQQRVEDGKGLLHRRNVGIEFQVGLAG